MRRLFFALLAYVIKHVMENRFKFAAGVIAFFIKNAKNCRKNTVASAK